MTGFIGGGSPAIANGILYINVDDGKVHAYLPKSKPGDYNGDGKTDVAVFRPSTGTWFIQNSGGGTTVTNWGANGDAPIGQPVGTQQTTP